MKEKSIVAVYTDHSIANREGFNYAIADPHSGYRLEKTIIENPMRHMPDQPTLVNAWNIVKRVK